jgi:dienelactone hydrolase
MHNWTIWKILSYLSIAGLGAAFLVFLMAITPKARIIAWDIFLPVSLLYLLAGIAGLGIVWLAFTVAAKAAFFPGWRAALPMSAIMLVLMACFSVAGRFISSAYSEPQEYRSLESFDQSDWERFDAAKWALREARVRTDIRRLWGEMPARAVAPEPVIESTVRYDGYTLQKVRLKVEASGSPTWDSMPVYILIPDKPRSTPCPAVIVHHQHAGKFQKGGAEPAGLMGDPRQAVGVDLVRRGYVVVCHDALCFGERREASEKFTAFKLLLSGRTLNGKYVWDVSRLIDYLSSRPEIDRERIAIAGHSLGGQMAVWCAAYDMRLKVAVSNCGMGRIAGPDSVLEKRILHNYAFYLPGMVRADVTTRDVAGLVFPRPFFISAGTGDPIFPVNGVAEMHSWLEQQYAANGLADRVKTLRHVGPHMWPERTKEQVYAFLDAHL